jgi:hypothetical protein
VPRVSVRWSCRACCALANRRGRREPLRGLAVVRPLPFAGAPPPRGRPGDRAIGCGYRPRCRLAPTLASPPCPQVGAHDGLVNRGSPRPDADPIQAPTRDRLQEVRLWKQKKAPAPLTQDAD